MRVGSFSRVLRELLPLPDEIYQQTPSFKCREVFCVWPRPCSPVKLG